MFGLGQVSSPHIPVSLFVPTRRSCPGNAFAKKWQQGRHRTGCSAHTTDMSAVPLLLTEIRASGFTIDAQSFTSNHNYIQELPTNATSDNKPPL